MAQSTQKVQNRKKGVVVQARIKLSQQNSLLLFKCFRFASQEEKGNSMIFYKKETEKTVLVDRPGVTSLSQCEDMRGQGSKFFTMVFEYDILQQNKT